MANRTDRAVKSIHETNPQNPVEKNLRPKICKNPQNLVEKMLRLKIHENAYWKERCFGLTAETLVETRPWSSTTSAVPTAATASHPFNMPRRIMKNEDRKYVRVLGAFYIRLTWSVADIYQYLEPLYNDSRKLRRKLPDGNTFAN